MKPPIRLLALDIDGTLLNPEFQISPVDMAALRRAHAEGVEVVVVTGRRHTFALPIVQQLGFDLVGYQLKRRDYPVACRAKPFIATCCRSEPAANSAPACGNFAETRS